MLHFYDSHTRSTIQILPGFYLVSRPKLAGPGTHYGVLSSGIPPTITDMVFHLTTHGHATVSFEEFARGHQITIHEGRPPDEADKIIRRAEEQIKWRSGYHLLNNNCEHSAKWVIRGKLESAQADVLMLVLVAGGLAVLAAVAK